MCIRDSLKGFLRLSHRGWWLRLLDMQSFHHHIIRQIVLTREGVGIMKRDMRKYIPVSYTHLDVYKRQGVIFRVPGQLEKDGTPHYVTADEYL